MLRICIPAIAGDRRLRSGW
eukprot:gene9579-biopygen7985